MRVVVTGASGLIGSSLVVALAAAGHRVLRAVRRPITTDEEVCWDVGRGTLEPWSDPADAVIHLAGESLAGGRWTPELKRRARASRVEATQTLARWLAALQPPPRHWVAASAIGYYGDRGAERLDERSARGSGFLAEVAEAWEEASDPLERAGARTAQLRIGLVLARRGGALPRLLVPARLGLSGPLGSGRQFWSWITLRDVVGSFRHVLEHPALTGPLNAVAPESVTQREFARTLGRVLGRPAWIGTPRFLLRLALGGMADALLLASQRVLPSRLQSSGFAFRDPTLETALRAVLESAAG